MSDNKSLCDTCLYKYCCVQSEAGTGEANHSVCPGYAPFKDEKVIWNEINNRYSGQCNN